MGSLVMSLSQKMKANKTQAMVNKLQLVNLQNYERTAMLIMQQEGKRLNCVGHPIKERRSFIHQHLLSKHPLRSGLSSMHPLVLSCEPRQSHELKATDDCTKQSAQSKQ